MALNKRDILNTLKNYPIQVLGALLLNVAFTLALLKEPGYGYIVLIVTLLIDLYLIKTGQDVITKWIRRQFPGWGDKIFLVVKLATIILLVNPLIGLWWLLGTTDGHFHFEK